MSLGHLGILIKEKRKDLKAFVLFFIYFIFFFFFFFFISYSISFFHIFHLLFHILFHFFIFLFHSILHLFHIFIHTGSLLQTGFIVSHFLHLCHILLPSTFYFMFHIYFILQLFVSNFNFVCFILADTYLYKKVQSSRHSIQWSGMKGFMINLFVLMFNIPVNNSCRDRFLGFNQYFGELMCLAQRHNIVPPVGIKPRT